MKLWVLGVVMLVACGDGGGRGLDDPDRAVTSGSRIKLRWHDFGAGARTPAPGLVDRELDGELCYQAVWDDGRTYCTPSAPEVVYLDDQCTQPAVQVIDETCQAAPRYAVSYRHEACGTPVTRMFEIGAPIGDVPYFKQEFGTCYPAATGPLRAAGPEVPRGALAELSIELAPAPGRIARAFLVSADGLKAPAGLYDGELDEPCYVQALGEQAAVCLPYALGEVTAYADQGCSKPLASAPSACETVRYVARHDDVVCKSDAPRVYASGARIAGDQTIYRQSGTCGAGAQLGDAFFELGAEVEPAMLTLRHDGSGGVKRVVATDGASDFSTWLYDSTHELDCLIFQMSDGAYHCVSPDVTVLDTHRDAECQRVLHLAQRDRSDASCAVEPAPKLALRFRTPGSCGEATADIYEVGEPYAGAIFSGSPGSCTPSEGTRTHEYFELGRQRSIDELPKARLVVDH